MFGAAAVPVAARVHPLSRRRRRVRSAAPSNSILHDGLCCMCSYFAKINTFLTRSQPCNVRRDLLKQPYRSEAAHDAVGVHFQLRMGRLFSLPAAMQLVCVEGCSDDSQLAAGGLNPQP